MHLLLWKWPLCPDPGQIGAIAPWFRAVISILVSSPALVQDQPSRIWVGRAMGKRGVQTMRGTVISRLRLGVMKLFRDQGGNALMLTAAAIFPVIGIVGSGIDIGRAYMAQLRLQQACDAGVLAGRRYMGATAYSDQAEAEALKMFDFNYPAGLYGSQGVTFESEPEGKSDVVGTATARLPTSIMHMFGFNNFELAANCGAKLEIANVDVMLVLDVTGSMKDPGTNKQARIDEMKDASMVFFKVMTDAEKGNGRLRIGVVPYSSTVNVGQILLEKNPDWLANSVTLPSRTPKFNGWKPGTTTTGAASNGTAWVVTGKDWANVIPSKTISGKNKDTCGATPRPGNSTAQKQGVEGTTQTGQTVDSAGNQVTTSNITQNYRYLEYQYAWSSGNCYQQSRTMEYTQTTPSTLTQPPLFTEYIYQDRVFPVGNVKTGGPLVSSTGFEGANESSYWGGCIMERKTTPFASNKTAPPEALDMNVDDLPGSSDDSRWKLLIPEVAYARAQTVSDKPTTTGNLTVKPNQVSSATADPLLYQSYKANWPSGWGVCPAAAMKLTKVDSDDETMFNDYIKTLQPVGGTYHDVGMAWGVRLLSPTGLFADENAKGDDGRPIDRHIIFMTDGAMSPDIGNLSFQGYEYLNQNVGGSINSSKTELTARHNNRFVQLCKAAHDRNITVWVVALSVKLTTPMTNCATPGKAYETVDKDGKKRDLKEIFASIAGQISRLRLSQ